MTPRSTIASLPRAFAAVAILIPGILLYSAVAVIHAALGGGARDLQWVYLGFARLCLRVGATRLIVIGAENVKAGTAYVIASNHTSNWDPPVLIAALPDLVVRFVVKDALTRIPILGSALERTGNVRVERRQASQDVRRLQDRMLTRDPCVSMLFFAEGQRNRGEGLGSFKMGAFATAISERLPVLPVAIAGTRQVFPNGTLWVRRGTVVVAIGPPITTASLDFEERAALRDRAHVEMSRLLRTAIEACEAA